MASLFDKVQTLLAANMHALLDEALKKNSLAVLDEYIRQVESNLVALEDATATIGGNVKTTKRKFDEHAAKLAEMDERINLALKQGKEGLAVAAQTGYNSESNITEAYRTQYNTENAEYQKLLNAKLKLEAKLTSVKQEREEMQALLELAKSKEMTAKTMQSLDNLMGSGDQDVARIADSIRRRLDKAQAASETRANRLDAQMDELVNRSLVDDQLAARKKKLGL